MTNPLLVALSGPSEPAREQEYDEWYDSVHVPDVLRIPGVVACTRYRLSETQLTVPDERFSHLAIFEIEPAAVGSLPAEMAVRFEAGELSYSDVSVPSSVTLWEPVASGDGG